MTKRSVCIAGKPVNETASARPATKCRPSASLTASVATDRLPHSFAPPQGKSMEQLKGATTTSPQQSLGTGGANSSAPASSCAIVPSDNASHLARQIPVGMTTLNSDLDNAPSLSQIQPQLGTVLVRNQQGFLVPAGPNMLPSQLGPQAAPSPQPSQHPHPQVTTSQSPLLIKPQNATDPTPKLFNPQMATTLQSHPDDRRSSLLNPHLLQQPKIADPPAAEDSQHHYNPQTAATAAHLPAFLPQLPDRRQLTSRPVTAPAWAADHLQVLPQTCLGPGVASGGPSGPQMTHASPYAGQAAQPSKHPTPQDAAGQSLQPASVPQAADPQSAAPGQSPSEVQHPLPVHAPFPCHLQRRKAKPSTKQQAIEAGKLALQTEDAQKGVQPLQVTCATPVTALQATAAAQTAAAAAQPPVSIAQPPPARTPIPGTAAVQANACCAAEACHDSAQPASQLLPQGSGSTAAAPADTNAPSAAALAAAPTAALAAVPVPAPAAAPSDHTRIPAHQARSPATAQRSSKPKKGASDAKAKEGRLSQAGRTPITPQTQLAPQASDSAAAASSLQGYLAHASPRSISKLKQDLRKPSASDSRIDGPELQPATVDTSQLQAASAHKDAAAAQEQEDVDGSAGALQEAAAETRDAAALQQQPAADSSGQLDNIWDPAVADTLKQFQALRQNVFAYASQVPDPVTKQKFADVLAGKPVSPMLSCSSGDSDLGSSSDSNAEPDQDTTGALLPVLDMHQEDIAIPVRHSSNRALTSTALHPASNAQPHRQAQLVPYSSPSSAQPSQKRPLAMRSVGQLHSIQPFSQHQPARRDQATPIHMPNQANSPRRSLTTRTAKRKHGHLPDASVMPVAHALPCEATVLAQNDQQPAGRKRGTGTSDALLDALVPGTL